MRTEDEVARSLLPSGRAKFRLEVAHCTCGSLGRKWVGWRVTSSRCGASSPGTAGSRFNPATEHQESPLSGFSGRLFPGTFG